MWIEQQYFNATRVAIFKKQYLEPNYKCPQNCREWGNTLAEHRSFYANLCRAAGDSGGVSLHLCACQGDSPSNRIQITFPPSPSAEALCGHGTPPYGSTIILYGLLKAARSRTARPKNAHVITAIQTIGVNKGERY